MNAVNLNKKTLTLSIVIPAYNEEHHLKNCLDAIALQTVKPDEVIVVDNNSTDRTLEIAKSYPFVRVIKEKQQGIVFARDAGFNVSKSSLIGRIDSDTIMPKDWVEKVKAYYSNKENSRKLLTGGGYFYNVWAPKLNGWIQGQIAYRFIRMLMGFYSLWGSNMVIPRSVWLDLKTEVCKRNDVHEDVDLGIHAHEQGYQITYTENLRVGVYARRIWTERDKLKTALARWPQTMRVHERKGWWVPVLGNLILVKIIVPVGLAADYFANFSTRR